MTDGSSDFTLGVVRWLSRAWASSVGVQCCVVDAWSVGQTQHQGRDGWVEATGNTSVMRRARTPERELEPMPSSIVATRGVTRGALRVERRVLHRDDDHDGDSNTRTACHETRASSTSFSYHIDQLRLHHSSCTSVLKPYNYGETVVFRP